MTTDSEQFGPIGRALVRAFVERQRGRVEGAERRAAYGALEGWVSVIVNTALFALKLVLGLLTGSIALLADAVHTLADSITSVVIIVSSYVAGKPPDKEHPFGHGRIEAVAAVTVAVLLAVAAVEFGRESVLRIIEPEPIEASWPIIAVVLATAGVKEWLARFAQALARATGNAALEADAWHHRSDVLATVLVVAAMVASRFGLTMVDGWMGVAVSLVLLKVALHIARRSIDSLLGTAPTAAEISAIKQAALDVAGVRGVHDIVVHRYGELRFVSLHIVTSHQESPSTLHEVAERVERAVGEGHHGSVCVHVDPVNAEHPEYERVHELVARGVAADPRLHSFHDLRLLDRTGGFAVVFDLNLQPDCSEPAQAQRELAEIVRREAGAVEVIIEVEPHYSYQP